MNPLPTMILGIALLVAGFGGGWMVQAWRYGEKIIAIQFKHADDTAKAVGQALEKTTLYQRQKDEALHAAQLREMALRRDVAAVAGQRNGLRDELAASRRDLPGASREAARDYAAALADVFEQCTDRYSGVAEKADGHSFDALKFEQSWPKE